MYLLSKNQNFKDFKNLTWLYLTKKSKSVRHVKRYVYENWRFSRTVPTVPGVPGEPYQPYQANRTSRTRLTCKIEDRPDEAVPPELAKQYQTSIMEGKQIEQGRKKIGSFLEYQNEDPEPFADEHPDKKVVDSEKSDNEEKEERQKELADETKPFGPVAFDQDALVKLCGSQGKRKSVDSTELLDLGVIEKVGNSSSKLMKQKTSDNRPPSNKGYLGSSSRKTNSVTYLAKMAIKND
ncbi:hypothetical protein BpHYR1_023866 [Brachionus plicatilis]|uniref:Uncharacterized protein n=1 Tax=Brachionus plicatilis TaxID=10195 RepID=A0A3M7RP56_BRAPC|nr:hypothetical protein BpHYR1_023866 [Brachionus plicatilis]